MSIRLRSLAFFLAILVGVSIACTGGSTGEVRSATIYIRADGSIDPPTANIASVDNVTYTFTDNIDDSIVIERSNILCEGAGYTVQGAGTGTGIYLAHQDNVTVGNTRIVGFTYGVWLYSSGNCRIAGNNASDNDWGIFVEYSTNITVAENDAASKYYGICASYSNNTAIYGNNAHDNNFGIVLDHSSNGNTSNNDVYSNIYDGFELVHSSNNAISDNNIYLNGDNGVYLRNSNTTTIARNNITNNEGGIFLCSHSSNNTVSGNSLTDNVYGVYLHSSSGNNVTGNFFVNDGMRVWNSYDSGVSDNLVNDQPLVYLEGASDIIVGEAGQAILVQCNRIRVENLTLSNTTDGLQLLRTNNTVVSGNSIAANSLDGIFVLFSENNTISGNNITSNDDGIMIYSSSNNIVSGNIITDNDNGVSLPYSPNNTVSGNNMTANGWSGVNLQSSSNNTISRNTVTDNGYGVFLSASSNNVVSCNHIRANNRTGVYLDGSPSNTISGNNIVANSWDGVRLAYSTNNTVSGNKLDANDPTGVYLHFSSGNRFFHNGFLDNTQQAHVSLAGYLNFWHDGYPSGGNYWSDDDGNDTDHDGLGDIGYVINAENIDEHPLMGPHSDFQATPRHHVQTICNSTITGFQFNSTAIAFNVTGETGASGFCRICIPSALMNDAYRVLVNGSEISHTVLPFSNSTHSYLYFTYDHPTQKVEIILEFPSFLVLPLFTVATLVAVSAIRKKHASCLQIPTI